MKRLTIITICRNIASTIERTCQSIVNQTFQDFEWIVVDGASTDGTVDILKKYSDRIDILISEPDKGIYDAMNKGIKKASGEYLLFMNGGDKLYEEISLEKAIKYFNKDISIVSGALNVINKDKKIYTMKRDKNVDIYKYTLPHGSSFIKKQLFYNIGLYDTKYKICADFDFFQKCFKKKVSFLPFDEIISILYLDGVSSQYEKKIIEDNIIKKKNFPLRYFNEKHKPLEEIKNCIKHPRYLIGKIKKIFIKWFLSQS